MGVTVPEPKIHVKVFHLFGYLLLQSALLLTNLNDPLMGCPEALHIL